MADRIEFLPYIGTSSGITVNYRRNGKLETRTFAAGTSDKIIHATIMGTPLPPVNEDNRDAKAEEEARLGRAANAQPPDTTNQSQLADQDKHKRTKIEIVAAMRTKLLEAKIRGANMMKDATVEATYAKLFGKME